MCILMIYNTKYIEWSNVSWNTTYARYLSMLISPIFMTFCMRILDHLFTAYRVIPYTVWIHRLREVNYNDLFFCRDSTSALSSSMASVTSRSRSLEMPRIGSLAVKLSVLIDRTSFALARP